MNLLKPTFQLESFALSNIGLARPNNEDTYVMLPHYYFFALADGMGGHKAGEVASEEAISFFSSSIEELFLSNQHPLPTETLSEEMKQIFVRTNRWVHHLGQKHKKYEGMGTTLCSILLYQNSLIYGHIGDSRIYLFRGGILTQLTRDHSLMNEGNPSNILTRAVGTCIEVKPDMGIEKIQKNDRYLICSDGLSDVVSDETIAQILNSVHTTEEHVHLLVEKALASGGNDNITALAVRVI